MCVLGEHCSHPMYEIILQARHFSLLWSLFQIGSIFVWCTLYMCVCVFMFIIIYICLPSQKHLFHYDSHFIFMNVLEAGSDTMSEIPLPFVKLDVNVILNPKPSYESFMFILPAEQIDQQWKQIKIQIVCNAVVALLPLANLSFLIYKHKSRKFTQRLSVGFGCILV